MIMISFKHKINKKTKKKKDELLINVHDRLKLCLTPREF